MREIPIYQVDAFTSQVFRGNPAAVCPLDEWLDDETLVAIAAENNLSETAFFLRGRDPIPLRWFTPRTEVPLCGHATLATAHVILSELAPSKQELRFASRKRGELAVKKLDDGRLELDFPAMHAEAHEDARVAAALGCAVRELFAVDHFYLAVVDDEAVVRGVAPDMRALAALPHSPIVTARGAGEVDFVSRFFAPSLGIDEDPVTGSAHCVLTPFWAKRLGKNALTARQLSARGGELGCELRGGRVGLAGHAVRYLRGAIYI
jgi:PhzF family phenazine biosynthesis protein